jgi:hypothetical protein
VAYGHQHSHSRFSPRLDELDESLPQAFSGIEPGGANHVDPRAQAHYLLS